jgi:carotenoid cleavage dioxygenase
MNAYDDGDEVVLDVVRHPRMFDKHRLGPDEGTPTLERWTIDLGAGKLRETRVDDRGQEFPRVDERRVGRKHRFGYAVTDFVGGNAIMKHDLDAGTCETRNLGAAVPGEFVFVPRAADAAEDDGWVLGLVYDPARDASDFVVLNARDVAGEPEAVVHLPVRVPFGFHGNWVPTA